MRARGRSSRALCTTLALFAAGCATAKTPAAAPAPPSPPTSTEAQPPDEAIEVAGPASTSPDEPSADEPPRETRDAGPEGPVVSAPVGASASVDGNPLAGISPRAGEPAGENPCFEPPAPGDGPLEATRRRLYQTLCGAAVWFDGLFGDEEAVAEGQNVRGRVELSTQYSEFWGFKARGRLRVRADLPRFKRKVHAFVGRENEDEFIADRTEGLALRSQFFEIESEDRWVAGLGYGIPGSYKHRNDLRVGARLGLDPDVFVQLRHRRNWFMGDRSAWRFRETLFYTIQDGFGTTTSLDFDHVLNRKLLGRLATVGTFSEATEGVRWRSAVIFYRSLKNRRALAQETYVRGETDHEVPLREYGLRLIFRRPILGRDWLFGEVVTGYGWVREEVDERREGSALIGFGVDLLFGRGDPY